ncbi:unnamed protein product [Closterium sp. Naga37s-1]|nr:unnamed protein product [Closterium sp. Naga37s-1]
MEITSIKRAAIWIFAGLGLALAVISCCDMADNYFVLTHPDACIASSNGTHCAAEFRVARRSLGVVPQTPEQVTSAMIAAVQAQVTALIAAADEIKTNNVREDHFTNVMARSCARQATIALRYLGQAGDAVEAGTNQLDVPYWLAAADTQIDNCVDGFQTFSPAAQGFPAYVHLEYTAKKAGSTLEALLSITNAAAKAVASAATSLSSTEEDVAPVRGRRMAVRSSSTGNGAMDWLEEGLFVAFGIKFVNTAGPQNHQAVAFRATGDQTALFNYAFEGSQDTLYVDAGRQYYKNCYIGGSQDFIFGDAAVVIDAPKIQLHPSPSFGTLTASGRAKDTPTGIVIRDAVVSADKGTTKVYLGRPWKKCAFTVFINTFLPAVIEKDGWLSWNEGSCMFLAEAGSKGPGAASSRADWVDPGIITSASGYDANTFTQVNSWLKLSRKGFLLAHLIAGASRSSSSSRRFCSSHEHTRYAVGAGAPNPPRI